jgi:hypothetical protein
MPWESLFADRMIGDINDGNCVIVQSFTNVSGLMDGVRSEYYSEDAVKEIREDKAMYAWDGSSGTEQQTDRFDNQGHTFSSTKASDQFLQWDIYLRAPIENGKWKEDGVPEWYWGTIIGNDIKKGKIIRLERNPDPDDEVPIKMIHLFPDDSDTLYHVMMSQILRSNYSVECTLKNQAIDNISMVNNPPIMAVEGMHRVRDFRFKAGALWPVDDINAIKEFSVRDTTQSTAGLLNLVESDSMRAAQLGPSQMDEFAGSRTSASEAIAVNRNSMQPQLMQVRYVLEQFLPWYGSKLRSYWQAFSYPEQVLRLTDEPKYTQVRPKDIYGEFDVEVNIVDEYEDSALELQKINNILMTVASSPMLIQSQTHQLNVGELIRRWLEKQRITGIGKIVMPAMGVDASRVAKLENIAIVENGMYDRPQMGENHQIHLSEHTGERIRWNGIEDQNPNVALLDQHIAETRFLMEQEQMSAAMQQAPAGTQNQTEGEAVGNEVAGLMGGMA